MCSASNFLSTVWVRSSCRHKDPEKPRKITIRRRKWKFIRGSHIVCGRRIFCLEEGTWPFSFNFLCFAFPLSCHPPYPTKLTYLRILISFCELSITKLVNYFCQVGEEKIWWGLKKVRERRPELENFNPHYLIPHSEHWKVLEGLLENPLNFPVQRRLSWASLCLRNKSIWLVRLSPEAKKNKKKNRRLDHPPTVP